MGLKQLFVSLLAIGSTTASVISTGLESHQVNKPLSSSAANAVKPVGYLLGTKVTGNKAASGRLAPYHTEIWLDLGYSALCDPKVGCKGIPIAPSILYIANGKNSAVALNSTATVFGEPPPTQEFYVDYVGAIRYLTPPEIYTINNEPFNVWNVAKSKTTGNQILEYVGSPGGNAPAPFYLCPRNTGPVFSPPKYPVYYQLYAGTKGFFANLNTTGCIQTEVNLTPSKIGAYLFL